MPALVSTQSASALFMPMMTSPGLQSPVLIDTRRRSSPRSLCTPSRRRTSASTRRRRHCARTECHTESALHPFDLLPWISALDTSPDSVDLADIADLSQLVVDEPPTESSPSLGAGPIRRRKTSLRSNPLAISHENPPHTPTHTTHFSHFDNLMPVFSCEQLTRS